MDCRLTTGGRTDKKVAPYTRTDTVRNIVINLLHITGVTMSNMLDSVNNLPFPFNIMWYDR